MAHQLLEGKKGIIFGALDENSIAWKTAEKVYNEGGRFVLTNAPIASRMGTKNELATSPFFLGSQRKNWAERSTSSSIRSA